MRTKWLRPSMWVLLSMLPLLALLAACGGGGAAKPPRSADMQGQVIGGNAQFGIVGTELSDALTVRVLRRDGPPLAGILVTFVVVQGEGSMFAAAVATDAEGYARNRWTLGTAVGNQRVEARTIDFEGTAAVLATFTATALAGPPVALEIVSGSGQSGFQTQLLDEPLVVRGIDQHGNPTPDELINFDPSIGTAAPRTAVTDAAGLAQTRWTLGVPTGRQTMTASVAGRSVSNGFSAHSNALPPSDAEAIEVVSSGPDAANQHAPIVLKVKVTDRLGNGVPNVSVNFSSGTAGVHVRPQTMLTDAQGFTTCTCYVHVPGLVTLLATAQGVAEPARVDKTILAAGSPYDGVYVVTGQGSISALRIEGTVVVNLFDCTTFIFCVNDDGTLALTTGGIDITMATGSMLSSQDWVYAGTLSVDAEGRATGLGSVDGRYCDINMEDCPWSTGTWTAERL